MTENTLESTRQAIIDRLNGIRDGYDMCLSDVSAEVGNNGTEWSMVDLLRHTTADYLRNMVKRVLDEDNPNLGGGGFDPEAGWRRIRDNILADIDSAVTMVMELTPEQLERKGDRNGETVTPLSLLEMWAGHYEEHLAQLRDEIRPREGLPSV